MKGPALAVAWERSSRASASPRFWSAWAYCSVRLIEGGRRRGGAAKERAYLVSCVAGEGADGGLHCGACLVDVGVEGGGILVRHVD